MEQQRMTTSPDVCCLNVKCGVSLAGTWKSGWLLNSGLLGKLCEFCGSSYDQGAFCKTFHTDHAGWRNCNRCKKPFHCGCIASVHLIVLADRGGIECLNCAAKMKKMPDLNEPSPEKLHSDKIFANSRDFGGCQGAKNSGDFGGSEAVKNSGDFGGFQAVNSVNSNDLGQSEAPGDLGGHPAAKGVASSRAAKVDFLASRKHKIPSLNERPEKLHPNKSLGCNAVNVFNSEDLVGREAMETRDTPETFFSAERKKELGKETSTTQEDLHGGNVVKTKAPEKNPYDKLFVRSGRRKERLGEAMSSAQEDLSCGKAVVNQAPEKLQSADMFAKSDKKKKGFGEALSSARENSGGAQPVKYQSPEKIRSDKILAKFGQKMKELGEAKSSAEEDSGGGQALKNQVSKIFLSDKIFARSGEKQKELGEATISGQECLGGSQGGNMAVATGLDILASKAEEIGTPATKRHPRHKPTCECVVCIQPPSGFKHPAGCACEACGILKRRYETQRKKRSQSEFGEFAKKKRK